MAERFGPYHVPQQSRRDKLREMISQSHPGCIENLISLYDPSMISPDLLISASSSSSSSSSATHHMYMDPQKSIQLNPSSIHDYNNNPYLYNTPQPGLIFLDQSYHDHDNEMVLYKPVPLLASHATNNTTDKGLSLSLSSPHPQQTNLPLEQNLQRYGSSLFNAKVTGDGGGGYVFNGINSGGSRTSVPSENFSGYYGSILKGSRFLKPAQQLLEELCDVGRGVYVEKIAADPTLLYPTIESLGGSDDPQSDNKRNSRLISMLHELFRRYKQYYEQIQTVVASFESIAGLTDSAPFASLALKYMSRNFRSLKKAINDQLQFPNKSHSHINYDHKDTIPRFGRTGRGVTENQPVWRTQRGLPEHAVSVLKAWLYQHFLHPYPTDTDKQMLANQTGLSRSQVSNWFINSRVRLWKPMVEEIHMLETEQSQRKELSIVTMPNDQFTASTSSPKAQEFPSKRSRNNNMGDYNIGNEQPMHLSYDNFSNHHHHLAYGNTGVSLTLGLHQNVGIGLSEAFPLTAARRFGLDATSNDQGYEVSGFEAQNTQCGRNVIGAQNVHDFG